ncbi:hypothetical protein D918_06698 [Trichuris suis]|nr:hypothetical protein D918_06698 [Trichuris suis]
MKASNKEEYMHYVSKIIYHASSGAAVVGNQMTCSPQQGQMGSVQYGGMPAPATPMSQVHPEAMAQVHHMQGSSVNAMPNVQMSAQPQAQNVMMLLQSGGANRQPMASMQSRPVPNELQLFMQQLPINVRQQLSQLPPEEQSEMLKKLYESKRWQDQQAQQQRQMQQISQGQMHQSMMRQPPVSLSYSSYKCVFFKLLCKSAV